MSLLCRLGWHSWREEWVTWRHLTMAETRCQRCGVVHPDDFETSWMRQAADYYRDQAEAMMRRRNPNP
jgi:hypothetical protein